MTHSFVNDLSIYLFFFFFSSRRRHTRSLCDWSSDVCSSDLSRFLSAVDLVEQLLGRRDRGPAPERVGDELRGLGRAVAELLDEHLPHELAQTIGVGGGGRGRDRLRGDARPREGELRDLGLELRDDVLRLLFADARP